MGKFFQKIEQWAQGGPGGTKRVQTFRWLLLIGLIGIFIMILNSYLHVKEVDSLEDERTSPQNVDQAFVGGAKEDKSPFQEYEEMYEIQIKEILEKMVGIGDVEVLVTIESTEEKIVYTNNRDTQQTTDEKDRNGAVRRITDVSRNGEIVMYEVSGNESPIILKTIKPKIRGIIIVAGGVENVTVKNMVLDAVRSGLDVPQHRISITPRKQNK